MVECICGIEFTPKDANQVFHSRPCARESRAKTVVDCALKARFMGRRKARGLTRRAAGDQAGINYSALRTWLKTPQSRLGEKNLALMAAWLEISIDQALRLQGGTAEGHRKARALVGLKAHNEQARRDPKLVRKAVERMAKAVRGTHHSEEHRARQSVGLKAYRRGESLRRPKVHELHVVDNASLEQKLNTDLLTQFNRLRGNRSPTEREIQGWEVWASEKHDVCRGRVRARWNVLLKRRGLPGLGGNPADIETCDEACAFLEAHPWTGPRRPWRYWSDAPANVDQQFCQGHAQFCPRLRRRYENKPRKSPTTLLEAEITA
jgi:hypothetical protein